MELSRRDAVAALAAIGVGGGAVAYTQTRDEDGAGGGGSDAGADEDGNADGDAAGATDERILASAEALAAVVYPSDVEGAGEFARTYVAGRIADDDRRRETLAAVETLDARAEDAHGSAFRDLDPEAGDALLSEMGMEAVDPDPDGSDREQVRYYLVNELLYGLLTSPKASALLGVENPPGHAGGLDAYQQGPQG